MYGNKRLFGCLLTLIISFNSSFTFAIDPDKALTDIPDFAASGNTQEENNNHKTPDHSYEDAVRIGVDAVKKKDFPRALKYLKPAADNDVARAQFFMGVLYGIKGDYQDRDRSQSWFIRAAKNGYEKAQLLLVEIYRKGGPSIKKDVEKANYWAKKVLPWIDIKARKGDLSHQFNLGQFYLHGLGVEQSLDNAVAWHKKAATSGYADSQFMLGIILIGMNNKKETEEALTWIKKAADNGSDKAISFLSKRKNRL